MRKLIRSTLTAVLLMGTAVAAQAETLADALAFGYENSGLIDRNRALLRAADEDVAAAVAAMRPILNWSASLTRSFQYGPTGGLFARPGNEFEAATSGSLGLSLDYTLFDFGSNRLRVELQKELVLATRQDLLAAEQQVLANIVRAYLSVQSSAAFVQLRQNNVRLITQELSASRDRFEVGEITRTDVSLAEAQLAASQSELAAAQGDLAQAQENFLAAVGRRAGSLAPAPAATIPPSREAALEIARRTEPSLVGGQHQVAASELNVRRAELAMRPTVTLSGQLSIDDQAVESGAARIAVGGPLYQGGALASQLRRVQANRDAARAGLLETARSVDQQVGIAYSQLEVARASRGAFEAQVRAAQTAFDGVREEAQLGARTTLDVLDAEQDLLDARTNLISAQTNEILATYTILQAAGLLTAQNLGLNVQIYDPTAYYNLVDDAPSYTSEQGQALDRVLKAIGADQ